MTSPMLYTYGITWPTLDLAGSPAGLGGAPVVIEHEDGISALVSQLDAERFTPEIISTRSADLRWLGEQAAAHDRVVTWASDRAPVIPLPPFSLFRDTSGVRRMLSERRQELVTTLQTIGDAREYTVRVFRVEPDLSRSLAAFSPAIASLESRIATASPGQKYLLERKLDAERQPASAAAIQRVMNTALAALSRVAKRVAQDDMPGSEGDDAPAANAVINASFLVAASATQAFQEAVTALIDEFGTRGFRFEFTGPWAPYHFAQTRDG